MSINKDIKSWYLLIINTVSGAFVMVKYKGYC